MKNGKYDLKKRSITLRPKHDEQFVQYIQCTTVIIFIFLFFKKGFYTKHVINDVEILRLSRLN